MTCSAVTAPERFTSAVAHCFHVYPQAQPPDLLNSSAIEQLQTSNGTKGTHEYSIIRQSVPARRSPPPTVGVGFSAPSSPQQPRTQEMDINPRRELPPPAAMTLPPEPTTTAMGSPSQLPPLPPQWHTEDSLRQWLRTKAEEDRRRQEEERTRQETLKLEQRRIEQNMLRDAFQAGVPPQMVPLIFVGIGGGNITQSSLDVAQQVDLGLQQAQSFQPQQRAPSSQQQTMPGQVTPRFPPQNPDPSHSLPPDIRRDNRTIPPNPYASQPAPIRAPSPPQPGPASPTQAQLYRGSFQPARLHSAADIHTHHQPIPRLNTGEIQFSHSQHSVGSTQIQPGPAGPSYATAPGPGPAPAPTKPETQSTQSPSIYFHHWVPPSHSQPSTPSTRGRQESTSRPHGQTETQISSPGRKRKAIGAHPPPPPPSSQHEQPSPALSHASPGHGASSRMGQSSSHFRQQSDPSHSFRHHEQSESDSDNFQRYRPGRESILNPIQSSSRRPSTDAPGPAHGRPGREH